MNKEKGTLVTDFNANTLVKKLVTLKEFVGQLAHEINGPLHFINFLTSELKEKVQKGEIDLEKFIDALNRIEKASQRIERIAREQSRFIHSEKSHWKWELLREIVDEATLSCSQVLEGNDIKLDIRLQPHDLRLLCSYIQMSQVLTNLICNSIDAIAQLPEKWILIEGKIHRQKIFIEVTDSGDKIPHHLQSKIFTRYFTTKSPKKGTGLGLSICQNIVEKHGGRLFLNNHSINTSFVIELPMKKVSDSQGPLEEELLSNFKHFISS